MPAQPSRDDYQIRELNPVHQARRMRRDNPKLPRRAGYGLFAKIACVPAQDRNLGCRPRAMHLLNNMLALIRPDRGERSLTTRTATLATYIPGRWAHKDCTQETVQRSLKLLDNEHYIRRVYNRRTGEVTIQFTSKALPPPYIPHKAQRAIEYSRSRWASQELRDAAARVQAAAEAELFEAEKERRRSRKKSEGRAAARCAPGATSTSHISPNSF